MVILHQKLQNIAKSGQFINVYTGKSDMILPRPISLCEINKEEGTLRLLYQVVGKGTQYFSTLPKKQYSNFRCFRKWFLY